MKNRSDMITNLFFRLLPVQILLLAIGSINSVIDGVMASNFIGADAMTVTGLYMPLIKVAETINVVLLGGSQILCGQFLGRNQVDRTRKVFSLDMILIVSVSVLFTLISLFFPMCLARAVGADAQSAEGLRDYILGMAIGVLPQMLGMQLTAFLQLEQQQKRTYVGIGLMMFVNAALDYLFIVVLHMGMFGLGLSTSISYWAFFLVLGLYYFKKKAIIQFSPRGLKRSDLGSIVRIGIPGAITTLCLSIRGFILNALLLKASGGDGVAALAALNTFGGLLYAVSGGLAATTRLLVSVYAGEEDRDGIVRIMKAALYKGVPIVCGVALLTACLAVPLTRMFFRDPGSSVFFLTKWLFRIYPLCMPLSAICVIFTNFNQSMARMKIVHVLSVIDGLLGTCLASLALAPLCGAIGVWIAHVLNGVLTTIAVVVYAILVRKRFPRSTEDLIAIPDGFGVPDERRLSIPIRSAQEVTNASERIMAFCRARGIERKHAYYAGLCMEELAANVTEHGFNDGKPHTAEIRVVQKDDGLLLRIKDDCRAFNPQEAMELMDPKDITHNIGLRIVQRYAKKLYYNSALGLNVITIEL